MVLPSRSSKATGSTVDETESRGSILRTSMIASTARRSSPGWISDAKPDFSRPAAVSAGSADSPSIRPISHPAAPRLTASALPASNSRQSKLSK